MTWWVLAVKTVVLCTLWVSAPPDAGAVRAACGTADLSGYTVMVLDEPPWQFDGADVYDPPREALGLPWTVSRTREELICAVTTAEGEPSAEAVRQACPQAPDDYRLVYAGPAAAEPPPTPPPLPPLPPLGDGLLDMPPDAAALATDWRLDWLDYKLRWWGLDAAWTVESWQNRWDEAIYLAALRWRVPPRLLKRIIMRETQFWAWTGTDGETGLAQLTPAAADNVLRLYEPGYATLSPAAQRQHQAAWLAALRCDYCTIAAWADQEAANMDRYAQALAAYYILSGGDWLDAVAAWNPAHRAALEREINK